MKRKAHIILLVLLLLCVLSTTAFAIDESEVESAIAASSKEEVAGNVFIWFLCAIGFAGIAMCLTAAYYLPESSFDDELGHF